MIFSAFGRFPLVFGLVSYPPGPILESVFLWRVSVDRNLPVYEQLEARVRFERPHIHPAQHLRR